MCAPGVLSSMNTNRCNQPIPNSAVIYFVLNRFITPCSLSIVPKLCCFVSSKIVDSNCPPVDAVLGCTDSVSLDPVCWLCNGHGGHPAAEAADATNIIAVATTTIPPIVRVFISRFI